MWLLVGAVAFHFFFITFYKSLPRMAGLALVGAYGYFVYKGLLK